MLDLAGSGSTGIVWAIGSSIIFSSSIISSIGGSSITSSTTGSGIGSTTGSSTTGCSWTTGSSTGVSIFWVLSFYDQHVILSAKLPRKK